MKYFVLSFFAAFALITQDASAAAEVRYEYPSVNGLRVDLACATDTTFRSKRAMSVCTDSVVIARKACRYGGQVETCRMLADGEAPARDERVETKSECRSFAPQIVEVSRMVTTTRCLDDGSTTHRVGGEDGYGVGESYPSHCLVSEERTYKEDRTFYARKFINYQGQVGEVAAGTVKYVVPMCE